MRDLGGITNHLLWSGGTSLISQVTTALRHTASKVIVQPGPHLLVPGGCAAQCRLMQTKVSVDAEPGVSQKKKPIGSLQIRALISDRSRPLYSALLKAFQGPMNGYFRAMFPG